eukprot:TRINITY_DN3255_c0_g3_i1.p1 TRINITY_DN3255_c0_g3~~TRINITY_DN3255_c0_g3_i1.p1  ORF type:complete len:472 (+),score=75.73 TRINITY_DN3255_c0_g3_i1:88-1503(+)
MKGKNYLWQNKGSDCVDSRSVPFYINGTLVANASTELGGGCYARQGRRMLMNAILTPSNLTCTFNLSVCPPGGCEAVSVNFDPCKKYHICGSSMFKKRSEDAESKCAKPLMCSCTQQLDCCGVCGGDNTTCKVYVNDTTTDNSQGMNGESVGNHETISLPNMNVTGINAGVDILPLPPQTQINDTTPLLTLSQALAILKVGSFTNPPLWPIIGGSIFSNSDSAENSFVLKVTGAIANFTIVQSIIKEVITNKTGLDPAIISLKYENNAITVSLNSQGTVPPSPSQPQPQPIPQPSPSVPASSTTNITGNIVVKNNIGIKPGACKNYYFLVSGNIILVKAFVGLQSVASKTTSVVALFEKDQLPTQLNYSCSSPNITKNEEYMLIWTGTPANGTWSYKEKKCQNYFPIQGTWFVSLCNQGESHEMLSFQITLIETPKTATPTQTTSPNMTSSIAAQCNILLLLVTLYFTWLI